MSDPCPKHGTHMNCCYECAVEPLQDEIERLRLNHEIADRMGWRPDVMGMKIAKLEDEIERLRREVEVLRQYGNKDCTAMADEALAAKGEV